MAVFICALGAYFLVLVCSDPPATVDEPGWLNASYVTFHLAQTLAPPERWIHAYEDRHLGAFGNPTPPLGKLLIGAAVFLAKSPGDEVQYTWEWGKEPASQVTLPPASLLRQVRVFMVALGCLTLYLLYQVCAEVTGEPLLAALAPLLLAVTPVFEFHAMRVYLDVPRLIFLLGSSLATVRYLQNGGTGMLAISAVSAGLATAVKLNSAPIVAANLIMIAVRERSRTVRSSRMVLAAALPVATFVAVNPYLYPDPVGRSLAITSAWSQTLQEQRQDPQLASRRVNSTLQGSVLTAARGVLRTTVTPPFGNQLLAWSQRPIGLAVTWALAALLVAVASGRDSARRIAPTKKLVPLLIGGLGFVVAEFLLFGGASPQAFLTGAGVIALAQRARHGPRYLEPIYLGLILLAFLGSTALWLPFDWPRYYLPVIVWTPIVVVVGISQIVRCCHIQEARPGVILSGRYGPS